MQPWRSKPHSAKLTRAKKPLPSKPARLLMAKFANDSSLSIFRSHPCKTDSVVVKYTSLSGLRMLLEPTHP